MNSQETPSTDKASFAQIFEAWETNESENQLSKGQIAEGIVVDTRDDTVFLDIGEKQEGRVPLSDFNGDVPQRGSTFSVVFRRRVDGYAILSKKEADIRKGWDSIRDAFTNGYPVTGKVVSEIKGKGFTLDVEDVGLFLPASHLAMKYKDLAELKTKEIDVKIIEINEKNKSGVVSRKKLLEETNNEKWDGLLEKVKVGDKVTSKVVKIANFGVFCEVHEVIGLLRQNDISYKKFAPFKHFFQIGQEFEVVILELDKENNRLSLGLKQMHEDPWEWAKRELEKGMIVSGTVTSLTSFGSFVELMDGLEGLIHTTELSWSRKPPLAKDLLKKGQQVEAEVLDIDFENRRLSLSTKHLQPNPWDSLSSNVRVGNTMTGVITGITKYGAFVEVENGIEGLIHLSDITWDEKEKNPTATLKKGQSVEYKILDVNLDSQRISCGIKQLTEHPYEALKKKYPPGSLVEGKIKSIVSFGVFVEVEPGFEGLVHISEVPPDTTQNLEEHFPIGSSVRTAVLKIDTNAKKISLSIKDHEKAVEREEMAKYIKEDNEVSRESLGSFMNLK
ncbi:30S ribosomal protein S1 [Leptospira sp. GIMC2001]|uniref:30S ribosomal protein S1 n=1 Tax=Leptospira sp. GIMC2001 TaxID=1513297 RepID=UPI00234B3526|nr:30S ribosomal protein S1 [Leptospira sp. GIMC2001]WCL48718.1 30S ribosomal protein S1 [Leptospira sp. GIMC2001]